MRCGGRRKKTMLGKFKLICLDYKINKKNIYCTILTVFNLSNTGNSTSASKLTSSIQSSNYIHIFIYLY